MIKGTTGKERVKVLEWAGEKGRWFKEGGHGRLTEKVTL